MKLRAKVFATAAAVLGVVLVSPPGYADSERLEKQIEKLTQAVVQLQEVVKQQDREIKRQKDQLEQLQGSVGNMGAAELAKSIAPHMDKHLLHREDPVGQQLGNLRIGVGATGVVQGSIDGADVSGRGNEQTDASWSFDLEVEAPIGENGLAFGLIEAGQGEGLTDELSVYHSVNGDAAHSDSTLGVIEAWYEQACYDGRVMVTVGKIDLSNYVDGNAAANDETIQFLNGGLVNSLAIEFPADNGAGIHLGFYPNEWVELNLGWAEADADWEDVFDNSFVIGEVNIKPGLLDREGNYRFYTWYNGSDKAELDGTDTDADGWGFGVSLDQQLTDNLTVFCRAAHEDDEVYEVATAWSIGAEISGAKWNREDDALGIAIAQAILSDDISPDDTETLIEIYYSYALNSQVSITPDIQIIDSPGGDSHNDTLVVLGVRAQVNF